MAKLSYDELLRASAVVCSCNKEVPVQAIYRGGIAYVCQCGNRYEPCAVDHHAMIVRCESLEARVAKLEAQAARREIREGVIPTIAVDESLLNNGAGR